MRREQYGITPEEVEIFLLNIFPTLDSVLVTLNVPSLATLAEENPDALGLPVKDYRQDFYYALAKFGLLHVDAPARLLAIEAEDISPLPDVKEITDEANDFMDEEGAIERIIEKLGKLDGNQSIIVTAIVEVCLFWKLNTACTNLVFVT
jgi:hypothetical protein